MPCGGRGWKIQKNSALTVPAIIDKLKENFLKINEYLF
jgi:hypothetical protein